MIQRKSKRHLEFESLESMQLLSGAGAAVYDAIVHGPVAPVEQAPVADVAVNLSGTIRGTYRVVGAETARFNGQGTVSPIGKAHLQGKISRSSSGGQLTLNFGRRGKVFAAVTGGTPAGVYTYQITGGTRTFAGDSGTGVAVVSLPSLSTRGHFALSLQGGSSV